MHAGVLRPLSAHRVRPNALSADQIPHTTTHTCDGRHEVFKQEVVLWCKLPAMIANPKDIVDVDRHTLQRSQLVERRQAVVVCPAVEHAVADGECLQLWQLEGGCEGAGCRQVEAGQAGGQLVTRRELEKGQVGEGGQV